MSMLSTIIYTIGFLFIFSIAVFVFLKVKNMAKKQSTPKKQKEEGDDKQDPNKSQTNTNLIKVIIWRPISAGLVAQVGDPIMCLEQNDDNNNLMVINEEKRFKEDFNFTKDRVFELLEFSLGTENKTKSEKLDLINQSIKEQQELVNRIDADITLNEKYNFQDESLKLRQLQVLKNSLQKEVQGNYLRLAKGGVRQYEFISLDGVLVPYFFGSKIYRVYPDLLPKKKIFNQENTIFRNEVGNMQKNIISWTTVATLIVGVIMIGIGGWMMKHSSDKTYEITSIANKGAISCSNTLATINSNYGTIIEDYQQLKQKEIQNNINTEVPNINMGGIVIDPSKIQNK